MQNKCGGKQHSFTTPAAAATGTKAPSVLENASPQVFKATRLFECKASGESEIRRPGSARGPSARKLQSVAGVCLDGEFYGGKVRGSPFKPENDITPISGSTPTFVREEKTRGPKADVMAALAERKKTVDATSSIFETQFGDGSPSVRNRPKRSETAVQRVSHATFLKQTNLYPYFCLL